MSDVAAIARYVEWLMDRDRKSPGLKSLQGQIWETGYRTGRLRGEVFDDVPAAFARWTRGGIRLAIYSSGSVLAQRLLFESTNAGDLTPFVSAFFDTAVGAKASADSYRRISKEIQDAPERILFLSDVARELEAARAAACRVALCVRPGNRAEQISADIPVVRSFDEVL
jgi:enolase-phosphatase E1